MKLHEYQAKALLAEFGVPVPEGSVASNAAEAIEATKNLGGTSVVKAQVHAGGRGKAGGVKLARSVEEVRDYAEAMLGTQLVTHQSAPLLLLSRPAQPVHLSIRFYVSRPWTSSERFTSASPLMEVASDRWSLHRPKVGWRLKRSLRMNQKRSSQSPLTLQSASSPTRAVRLPVP